VPVEHERKMLLRPESPQELLRHLKRQPLVQTFEITQGYINKSARIRHVVPHNGDAETHWFTFKTKVTGNTVEIETEISIHDYHKLFLIAKPVIHKTRCKFQEGLNCWDVDFFKNPKSGDIYLSMAEVEMPEFELDLPEVHPLLQENFWRWIDANDKRFQNKNLSNYKKVLMNLKGL
jgi:CYTH domain-containing protein